MTPHSVDLMYLACNRLEFTRETFTTLLENTDWEYVNELFVYDDGSTDGTEQWLRAACLQAPAKSRLVNTRYGSPVAAQNDFIRRATAPWLAKCDNDAMLPPGWLRQSLQVIDSHPELSMLGIEAMYPHSDDPVASRSFAPAQFVSGLALYRRSAFASSLPRPMRKWFGLEEWQMAQGNRLRVGWITPSLPVFLLDRFPFDPWRAHSDRYIRAGWQRPWPKYDPACTLWHWRWAGQPYDERPVRREAEPVMPFRSRAHAEQDRMSVVVLSARAENLVPCVRSILDREPSIAPGNIIVVDDGARRNAEPHLPGVRWVQGVKPFVYARNANIGLGVATGDVVLLNDDARLITTGGFSALADIARQHPDIGLISAAIQGVVGNPNQIATGHRLRFEPRVLAFVCVLLPRSTLQRLGPLDERFVGYGYEDNDYCLAALRAGLRLAISEVCVVDHAGGLPSTFRSRPDIQALARINQKLFEEKYGGGHRVAARLR